jgi:hypothetical protein
VLLQQGCGGMHNILAQVFGVLESGFLKGSDRVSGLFGTRIVIFHLSHPHTSILLFNGNHVSYRHSTVLRWKSSNDQKKLTGRKQVVTMI